MSSYRTKPTPGDTAWFTADRFCMFIHFGLYAMAALVFPDTPDTDRNWTLKTECRDAFPFTPHT